MPSEETQFKPGNPGGPGRPKGKTLKEFARQYLLSKTDEEKIKFLNGLSKDTIWKMAEGNPHQSSDVEVTIPQNLIDLLNGISNKEDNSGLQGENTE